MKSRRMRLVGHVAHMVQGRKVYKVLAGKHVGNRPLGRQRYRWGGWDQNGSWGDWLRGGGEEWIQLAQNWGWWQPLVNMVMNRAQICM
jgi:hypothetical protein